MVYSYVYKRTTPCERTSEQAQVRTYMQNQFSYVCMCINAASNTYNADEKKTKKGRFVLSLGGLANPFRV
uniref:Uncharacterized protein n=1 Tax=Trichogramma kaykai TaxID=54128 RepID=A0ABD2WSW1_9HYME